ncbi:HAD-IA family hydrolase [Curtobacterium sp. VKM Ac-2922]|uniref:HAD-IA family hydrolase n=1 Tax=Curtobacterium sp. VKM Ac-2922 TaxID=2929475 RepID=UPI001FB1D80A|nr:HAD-IA family hydrolase [Curtobacterium sp. VKM Ac-2922]MCJ1715136.1 HAD-IA family hydrolase [Curtobacterium sp. VKM Ac-2922]
MTHALVFDCDGVLADTERDGHLPAFNETFEHFGLPVRWSEDDYASVLRIGGGKERLASLLTPDFVGRAGLPSDPQDQRAAVAEWHAEKTRRYTARVRAGALPARPGIARIVHAAHDAGWRLAIASTSAEASVRAVLEHVVGQDAAAWFAVFAGDVVPRKKPAPDVYELAIRELGVPADETVVVEDSANGLRAAVAAGLCTVVTVSSYTADEDFTGAALVVDSLGDLPDTPDRVLQDPHHVEPAGQVTLDTLTELLRLTGGRP